MKHVLVLCTGNSCRSQIAEGWIRHFSGSDIKVVSAGVETHGVNPRAIATMKEAGIDISGHTSNHVDEYLHLPLDYVLTVCDSALERCPVLPVRAKRTHHSFRDPAKATGTEQEIMQLFAEVRDEIRDFCKTYVATLV